MASFSLAVLLPPSNVERQVNDLQDRLFGELGLASAQALPVFAPLAALPGGFAPRRFERAVAPLRRGFRIDLAGPAADGNAVLLDLRVDAEGAGRLEALRAALLEAVAGPAPAPPLPLGPRLWLAEASSRAEAEAAVRLIGPAGAGSLGFASFEYALLEVDAARGEPWWREIAWRTYAHVRTRRSR